MSGYTKVNLATDVDDMAQRFGMPPGIEAHFGRDALNSEKSGTTYFKLGPDYQPPFGHRHAEQEEIYVVISGSAVINVEGEEIDLQRLDTIRLAPDTTRAVKGGPEGCEMIAFGAPRPAEQDAEMLPGWWG